MRVMATTRLLDPAQTQRLALFYMAVAAALWATVEAIGALLDSEQHPIEVVWMRYAIHLTMLLIIFGPRRRTSMVHAAQPQLQIVRGLLMLLMPICFLAAVFATEPANVLSIFWISPILTMGLGVWLLRERVAPIYWLTALGGWAGALLLVRPGGGGIALATIPALAMAGCLSLYLVMTRMLRDESTLTNLVYTAACVLVPISAVVPFFWHRPSLRGLVLMTAIGLIGLGTLFGFDRATELASVSSVAPMLYIQPVWSLGLAAVFDGTHPGRAAMLGTVLILAMCTTIFVAIGRRAGSPVPDAIVTADQPGSVQV